MSVEYRTIMVVWGQGLQQGLGAEPLVRESGAKPSLKLKVFDICTI